MMNQFLSPPPNTFTSANFHTRIISIEFVHRQLFTYICIRHIYFSFFSRFTKCTFVHIFLRDKSEKIGPIKLKRSKKNICMLKDISVSQIKIDLAIYKCATLTSYVCIVFLFTNLNVTARQQHTTK